MVIPPKRTRSLLPYSKDFGPRTGQEETRERLYRKLTGLPPLLHWQPAQPDPGRAVLGLRHLIEGGDLSQYGLINAVTRTAEDAQSSDRATELEMAGATVLDQPTEWRDLVLAA